jgi:hypothetical protein
MAVHIQNRAVEVVFLLLLLARANYRGVGEGRCRAMTEAKEKRTKNGRRESGGEGLG